MTFIFEDMTQTYVILNFQWLEALNISDIFIHILVIVYMKHLLLSK